MTQEDLAREVLAEVSQAKLMEYTETIAQWIRLSGSPEERKAFDYVQQELDRYGFTTHLYEPEAYISLPEEARLQVLSPEQREIRAITHSFSLSTPPEGMEGELVYQTYPLSPPEKGVDVSGKVVLQDGRVMPVKVLEAEKGGAIAQIHISGEHLHEMIASPVWGTPTPETASLLPHSPIISILSRDGDYLKELLRKGPVRVRLSTKTWTGWRNIPVLIADLPGQIEADTFVMFSGHIDSWYYGAMDNGTANATMLEVGRILAGHRQALRRGLRLAFWSGHSHGRYAGSTWYADTFWEELHDRCVAHVNVDSVGAKGATILSEACTMAEMRDFASAIIAEQTGQTLSGRRFGRAGDQSFWGCGIPSLFMSLSEQPPDNSEAARAFALLTGGPP
ncbi:MAG: M28 family peptidase, partial [Nitrospinota bacterium]